MLCYLVCRSIYQLQAVDMRLVLRRKGRGADMRRQQPDLYRTAGHGHHRHHPARPVNNISSRNIIQFCPRHLAELANQIYSN